ncbi:MAG: hypothetical protein ACI8UO_006520 [Verrucomicrobiales bacterium]
MKRFCVAAALIASSVAAAEFPDPFFSKYCFDCHDDLSQKGEIRLNDAIDRDWSELESRQFFERVFDVLAAGEMPPDKAKTQPQSAERGAVASWLHQQLLAHSETGGTVLRRLNRQEYENTIEALFGFDFRVLPGFPSDRVEHGFDNIGEDLALSPTLMEAYFEAAVTVADELFPPPSKLIESSLVRRLPDEMAISYSSSMVIDGSMRLAQRTPTVMRSCTWPTSFEAKASGRYRIAVKLSAFGGRDDGEPMQLHIYAKNTAEDKGNDDNPLKLRKLAEHEVTTETPEWFKCEADLYRGETPIFFYANAPLDSTNRKDFEAYLREQFAANPRLLAGWMAVKHGTGLRGGIGWDRVKAKMEAEDLDLSKATVDSPEAKKLIEMIGKQARQYVESISYQIFEEGPALCVHEAVIEGPSKTVEDDNDRQRQQLLEKFVADASKLEGKAKIEAILARFLPRAFRRPATDAEIEGYTQIVADHLAAGHPFEDGMHLAIRTVLVSPEFLYRETNPGRLDHFGLASRLSYFLTTAPPDSRLWQLSEQGKLRDPAVLKAETLRLLKDKRIQSFVANFTGQWLGTRRLAEIMPDQQLLDFKPSDRSAMIAESERFFSEILSKNLPLQTFIAPDFTFLNKDLATRIYGRDDVKSKNITRVSIPKGSPYGGILGQASVMMASANGVDTQPVLRGVWVLENVLGDAPPPPPTNVPAITPDTRGSKTVRDLMAAHTSEESCAGCHRKMDPLGFVLENFDPIGRWRTHYPATETGIKIKIDANAAMPDGAEFHDVSDLKAYVVEHIDEFGQCLAEKLMTYATGRHLTYADRHEISEIVDENSKADGGFQDLFVALVLSENFTTK